MAKSKSIIKSVSQKASKPEVNKATGAYYPVELDWDELGELRNLAAGIELLRNMASKELTDGEPHEIELVADMLNERGWNFYHKLAERFDQVKAATEKGGAE
jgi:hypothetical protein